MAGPRFKKGDIFRLSDRIEFLRADGEHYEVREVDEDGNPSSERFKVRRRDFSDYYTLEEEISAMFVLNATRAK